MNWYRDNDDGTGWHADRPRERARRGGHPGAQPRARPAVSSSAPTAAGQARTIVAARRRPGRHGRPLPEGLPALGAQAEAARRRQAQPELLDRRPDRVTTDAAQAEGSRARSPATARGAANPGQDRARGRGADVRQRRQRDHPRRRQGRAAGTSKSQLYRHFPDKEALVHAVIAVRGEQVLERETGRLAAPASFAWRYPLARRPRSRAAPCAAAPTGARSGRWRTSSPTPTRSARAEPGRALPRLGGTPRGRAPADAGRRRARPRRRSRPWRSP